ncbi:DUF4920 domain-containing protein [bacterium]|nr:DUF4920 domain-containing protein [bacterium]
MKSLKLIFALFLALGMIACSSNQQEAEMTAENSHKEAMTVEAADGVVGKITMAEVTPLNNLLNRPQDFVGKTILLEGKVTGRCMGSGCWVSLDTGNPEEKFYAKSVDESFVFPTDCIDKTIRIEGEVMVKNAGAAQEEHEHGEGDAGHECPQPVYFVNPSGAQIVMAHTS